MFPLHKGPNKILKDFSGYLQTDGYNVYDIFKENKDITLLHCMAHARRKFFEAKNNNAAVAEYALEQIGLLYAIERKAKEQQLTADEIFELRQAEAVPILGIIRKVDEGNLHHIAAQKHDWQSTRL